MLQPIFNLIEWLKGKVLVKIFVIYLRYLIGFAFVFASLVKMQGERFTQIDLKNPIGHFFEAMYQTGWYWQFLGWSQFFAGVLLLTQRFATVGALVFLPIILNIFVITHAIDFGSGTPIITSLMLLGNVFLILWDYRKWMILFEEDHQIKLDLSGTKDAFMTDKIWSVTGLIFLGLTLVFYQFKAEKGAFLYLVFSLPVIGLTALAYKLSKHK